MKFLDQTIKPVIGRYKLAFAIGAAIIATLCLTVVSVALYTITGSAKLDLSRPGYGPARKQLSKNDNRSNKFSSNGPLDVKTVTNYLKNYQTQSNELGSYDDFSKKLLDDAPLGLDGSSVAPSDGAKR
ncbi:MAG: hypothetical protein ACR2KZ_06270 [Segetibacter sp.]